MDEKLQRKLRRLGVVKGFRNLKPTPPAPARPTPAADPVPLPGEEIATPHGPIWVAETWYPGDHRHGCHALLDLNGLDPEIVQLLGECELGERPAFLDTETTGLAGGTGTLLFLTGVGVWETEGLRMHQVFLREPGEERAAMHYLAELLAGVTGLVTFNGGPFDLPLLETRFVLQRLRPRWRTLPHLDLLVTARLLWREHLPSRRLVHLEESLLEVQRTQVDLPSWMIPEAYRAFLRTGETGEMARIFYHNLVDILSLATLLCYQARLVAAPDAGPRKATEWVGLGRLFERAGRVAESEAAWQQALDEDTLPPDLAARLWRAPGRRHKRNEAWEAAFAVWEAWTERQPWAVEPLVERAKYYEWVAKDITAAFAETEQALERATHFSGRLSNHREVAELRHRRQRLLRKNGA